MRLWYRGLVVDVLATVTVLHLGRKVVKSIGEEEMSREERCALRPENSALLPRERYHGVLQLKGLCA